ncbi:MAG: tRNA pseudouridine(38-40) synthase TruA [Deferribacteraceae bacterium]|jgi:tRNA pseudouridine38-40 synthase|nr:tRNA pseudouridine(38-40) synthase TruA [Deferribacteraceae bacterium]
MFFKKCLCEYNGARYSGWQFQDGCDTVQERIETALEKLYNKKIRIAGAGRTDAGVHARGQVFSYNTAIDRPNHAIMCALNSMLPRDIAIIGVEDVTQEFHAQFSAVSKTYSYLILNRQARAALEHERMWFRRVPIDVDLMCAVLRPLAGTHDFTSFCVKKSLKKNSVRTVNFINAAKEGDCIKIRINADGFLHNMVRIIVGSAVQLTYEGGSPVDMKAALAARDRRAARATAPPQGLYLEEVLYKK